MEDNTNPAPTSSETLAKKETPTTQPVIQQPNPSPIKPASKFSIKAIIGIVIFLLLAGGAAASYIYREPLMALFSKPTPTPTTAHVVKTSPSPTTDPTADWETYKGEGFTFMYPNELLNQENCLPVKAENVICSGKIGDGSEPTIYRISVNTKTKLSDETSNVKYTESKINDIKTYTTSDLPSANGYEEVNFEKVSGGYIALLISPHSKNSGYPEEEKYHSLFKTILSTFKFTDTQITDTSNWKTYNAKKFSFKYPNNWIVDDLYTNPNNGEVSLRSNDYKDDGGRPTIVNGFKIGVNYNNGCVKSSLALDGPTPIGNYSLQKLDSIEKSYLIEHAWEGIAETIIPDKSIDMCMHMYPAQDPCPNNTSTCKYIPFTSTTFLKNKKDLIESAKSFKIK